MKKVAEDIIVETEYEGANVSCILTEKGKVLVDVPYFPQDVKQWGQILSEADANPVAYIVNTDHHFDHCIGNCHFGGKVVGHVDTYEWMCKPGGTHLESFMPNIEAKDAAAAKEVAGYKIVPPHITFEDTLDLHMGDKKLVVINLGGHTSATSGVYIPELKVLVAGDTVVSNTHPYMGQGNLGQWMKALETIKGMDIEAIIPGHGEVCGMETVDGLVDYFNELRRQVGELAKAGKSKEEASEQVDLLNYFPFEEESRDMAVVCVASGVELAYDEITASS